MNRGFALPLALVTLATLGSLVAALLFVAIIGQRSGGAMLELVQAQFGSESEAVRAVSELTGSQAMGFAVADIPNPLNGAVLTRFGSSVWLVEGIGRGSAHELHRRAGLVLSMRPPDLTVRQAFASPGAVELGGGTMLDLWGASQGELCAIEAADTTSSGFSTPALEPMGTWMQNATKLVPGGTTVSPVPLLAGDECDTTAVSNWGDPTGGDACSTYFPAVGVQGDLVIEGGVGQGALFVDGDLVVRGGFLFRGLVLVAGGLVVEHGGAQITGAVQVSDVFGTGSRLSDAVLTYSGCALRSALWRFGELSVIDRRPWFQLY